MSHPETTRAEQAPPEEASPVEHRLTPGRFAAALALLVAASYPAVAFGRATFVIRDFGLFSYPVAYFQREAFWHGHLPLWNPLNNCGLPFLAQWNTLTLYPPALIYLLMPLPWSLPFFCLLHMFWAGLGMYLLAQFWFRRPLAAAVAGVVFAFNGLACNFLMWPCHIAAFSWVPWVLWLGQRGLRVGGKTLLWATLCATLQMLAGGPETITFTWFLLLCLAAADCLGMARSAATPVADHGAPASAAKAPPETSDRAAAKGAGSAGLWRISVRFLAMALVVLLLCAAQLLPFLQLVHVSQRDSGYKVTDWAMPIWGWANLLVPLFRTVPTAQGLFQQAGQYWTTSYYEGVVTLWLAVVGLWRNRDRRLRFLGLFAGLGLVLALGEKGGLYRLMRYCVPGSGLARYPVKFVILPLVLMPLFAASGLDTLTQKGARFRRLEWSCALAILVVIGSIAWAGWRWPLTGEIRGVTMNNALTRGAFLTLGVLCVGALQKWASGPRAVLFGSVLVLALWRDLATHVPPQNPSAPPSIYEPGWTTAQANWQPAPKPGEFRAMLAPLAQQVLRNDVLTNLTENYLLDRLALFADCDLLEDIPQIYGFFSLVPGRVYRTTMLPYIQIRGRFPALLDFMSVAQTTAPDRAARWIPRPTAMPFATAGQAPVFAEDPQAFAAFFQTNIDFRQTVFLPLAARSDITANRCAHAAVNVTRFAAEDIQIKADTPSPALVVLSQTDYPAWKAYIDGKPSTIWRANYAFQALQVPPGQHTLRLKYEDTAFRLGCMLSAFGLAIWLAWYVRLRLHYRLQS